MAAKPYMYGRVIFSGKIATVQDWSCGVSVFIDETVTVADSTAWLASLAADYTDWFSTGSPSISAVVGADCTLEKVSLYWYPASATHASQVADYVLPSPAFGSGANRLSSRDAMVASLLTGTPGRSGRGRMYLPGNGAQLTDHQFTNAHVGDVTGATTALLQAINTSTYAGTANAVRPIVAGATSGILITQVRVDSLPDTQRRREDKIGAKYTDIGTL